MKKLLKISVLVGILMFALTMICYADEPTDTTTNGDPSTTNGDPSTTNGDPSTTEGDALPQTDDGATTDTTSDGSTGTYTVKYENGKLIVSGLPDAEYYYYYVDTNSTPSDEHSNSKLSKDGTNYTDETNVDSFILNKDAYMHIYSNYGNQHLADVKIEKPILGSDNYFRGYTSATYLGCLLKFGLPFDLNNKEFPTKFRYKIGKITDNSVLLAIKNNESSSFDQLLNYARNDNSPVYDETLASNDWNGFSGKINLSGEQLANKAYYYLYGELDTENGKYIPLSSVTLAQASVYPTINYKWYMFFYGNDDFNWDGLETPESIDDQEDSEQEQQEEEKSPVLPATGEKALVIALIAITAVVSVILFKKNKGLKIK